MNRVNKYLASAITTAFLLLSTAADAQEASLASPDAFPGALLTTVSDNQDDDYIAPEHWGFSYENDLFVPGGRDQDYTYGISLSYSQPSLLSAASHAPLEALNRAFNFADKGRNGGIELGFYGFTPEDITQPKPNEDDRPFSSLVYLSTSSVQLNKARNSVVRARLTYGVLGLSWVGQVQQRTHEILNGDTPNGWDHQISAGGEPTLRYSLSRQRLLNGNIGNTEWRQTQAVSIGYITEASWGLSFRTGQLNSQWHTFNPELASYAESSAQIHRSNSEWFFWGGLSIKARAYNAFLQGQFKSSEVTYKAGELNHVILEGWLGFTNVFANGYYASYALRGHTSEVKRGGGDRNVMWGGFLLGKRLVL